MPLLSPEKSDSILKAMRADPATTMRPTLEIRTRCNITVLFGHYENTADQMTRFDFAYGPHMIITI